MNKLASRLGCLVIGVVLCLTLASLSTRMTRSEGESMSASSTPRSNGSEATVIEVRIANRGEVVNGEVAWPGKRWVVRFRRSDHRELTFLVHSPIMDLGVSSDGVGQRGVLEKVPGFGYRFTPTQGGH